ncbi:MAG: hypothetical protein ACOC0C_02900 [Bacteroidota bacterium]
MGKAKYRQWNRIISMLLLSVFLLQVFSNVVWQHSHVMSDGTVITHTHPYSKSDDSTPFKNHHHSNIEILFLQYLESLVPFLTTVISLVVFASTFKYHVNPILSEISIFRVFAPGRSPPVV